jgi:hypothetical protein
MSLQLIAKQMEAKGRNGDSVLVHMTPGEVAGLQKLAENAGGSLSVNPETGLAEAFSLREMLPALVSGALMASGVGMPFAGAGGALTGGLQARHNDQDFLTGALMGGISGYGGATLAGGLSAAGAAAGTGMGAGAAGSTPTMAQSLAQTGQGFGALGKEAGQKAFMESVGGGRGLLRAGMSTLASAANAPVAQPQSPFPLMNTNIDRSVAPFQDIQAYQGMPMGQGINTGGVAVPTFRAADGGLAQLAKGGLEENAFIVPADIISFLGEGNTEAGYSAVKRVFPDAVAIRGKDGGQSDTVETSIEGKQPAAVAHGEMYLSPKNVKDAGGAKKLYAMMDKVRQQATGNKEQIKPVRLESAMA